MKVTRLFLLVALLLATTFAMADNIFTLTGTGGQSIGGYGIYPYYGNINGGATLTVMCDDFTTEVGLPSSWNANLTDFSTGDLSNTKFGSLGIRPYEEAFWLIGQTTTPAGSADLTGIQLAIWSLFDINDPTLQALITSNGYDGDMAQWLALASADASTNLADYKGDIIISPNPGTSGQEQLVETPEPNTMMLLGSGILGLSTFLRRRKLP